MTNPEVLIASNLENPIRPTGSTVILTCTVELSPFVDVPVTVNTVWTGPAGFTTTNTTWPIVGNSTTHICTTTISSFRREQSGAYACTVTISSTSPFLINSDPKTVTIGM